MRIKLAIPALALAFVLGGCLPQATLTTPFDPSAIALAQKRGSATVSGQAFLRRNDGVVVYAAGSEVSLIPATNYSSERMHMIYRGSKFSYFGLDFENDDPRYYRAMRTTVADGEGRFSFENVAAGRYFISTSERVCHALQQFLLVFCPVNHGWDYPQAHSVVRWGQIPLTNGGYIPILRCHEHVDRSPLAVFALLPSEKVGGVDCLQRGFSRWEAHPLPA